MKSWSSISRLLGCVAVMVAVLGVGGCATTIPFELSTKGQKVDPSQIGRKIIVGNKWPNKVKMKIISSGSQVEKEGRTLSTLVLNAVFIKKKNGFILDLIIDDIIYAEDKDRFSIKAELGNPKYIVQSSIFINDNEEAIISQANLEETVKLYFKKEGTNPEVFINYMKSVTGTFTKMFFFSGKTLEIGEIVDAEQFLETGNKVWSEIFNNMAKIENKGVRFSDFQTSINCKILVLNSNDEQAHLYAGKDDCIFEILVTKHVKQREIKLKATSTCLLDYRLNLTYGIFQYSEFVCKTISDSSNDITVDKTVSVWDIK